MAAPDCAWCEAQGFRSCDECGGPVFPEGFTGPLGAVRDLCVYCAAADGEAGPAARGASR